MASYKKIEKRKMKKKLKNEEGSTAKIYRKEYFRCSFKLNEHFKNITWLLFFY